MQARNGQQMRQPRIGEYLAPPGIEIVPASEDQRLHEGGASAVEALNSMSQLVPERVAGLARTVQHPHVLHPQHARRPEGAYHHRPGPGHQLSRPGQQPQLATAPLGRRDHRGTGQATRSRAIV
ncbi:MAG: hypothetical protein HYT81_13370 [Gemmatimonadetes bacterium]|nr:hypothetical protein [Gemmatimonadota bacterium]